MAIYNQPSSERNFGIDNLKWQTQSISFLRTNYTCYCIKDLHNSQRAKLVVSTGTPSRIVFLLVAQIPDSSASHAFDLFF